MHPRPQYVSSTYLHLDAPSLGASGYFLTDPLPKMLDIFKRGLYENILTIIESNYMTGKRIQPKEIFKRKFFQALQKSPRHQVKDSSSPIFSCRNETLSYVF